MPKFHVRTMSPTIHVWEVEADTHFQAEERAWLGYGHLIDSYTDTNRDEVLDSKEVA